MKDKMEILNAKALELAQKMRVHRMPEGSREFLVFTVAQETYAVEMTHVRELCPLKELTMVPRTPPFILGIVNIRGQIFSIVDIRKFFELPEKGLSNLNKVILLQSDTMAFGILADAIIGVKQISEKTIEPASSARTTISAPHVMGIAEEHIIILNAGRVLADEKMRIHEDI